MQPNIFVASGPLVWKGACMTALLWSGSLFIALLLGTCWGVLRAARVRGTLVGPLLDALTFVLRAIPLYVQLLLAYFVVPPLLGIAPSAEMTALVALGICSAAYVSQIVHGGIDSIDQGQWLACQALGYSPPQTLWYVILPQALRVVLPALIGEGDHVLKSTTIISSLGVLELTQVARNMVSRHLNPVETYCMLAVLYFCFSALLALAGRYAQQRIGS